MYDLEFPIINLLCNYQDEFRTIKNNQPNGICRNKKGGCISKPDVHEKHIAK